jgi:carbamoyl-phosphate synthase large subunit
MPKRADIRRVLIIGSGPIVIGQACEFDYSGAQACKALREEGISVVLVNSNPATIMTDPEFADRTYVEPVIPEVIEKILAKEQARGTPVDSVLPTLGGQTGLNCAMACHESGIFTRYNVRMLAATPEAINKAENRMAFRDAIRKIGLDVPISGIAHTWEEAQAVVKDVGLPCAIRPAYTLGGTGGGFATTPAEFEEIAQRGLEYSPISEILIEESLLKWKEFELEVMRDRADNVVIICSIENFDPMGVHTGDSITVAPAQTLTDREYQRMRDAAIAIIREIGVETGGSNIQFAVHPQTGRMCVIEMNPRVSRSSALASKATGFPIAKIATKLAIGYTLDELANDITKTTPACFEPAIDYCVVKVPRWTFEKFPDADETLTTQMKSVGEAMAIGRTFKEALQKAIRSMEIKRFGLGLDPIDKWLHTHRRRVAAVARAAEEAMAAVHGAAPAVAGSRAAEAPADTKEERAERWPIPEDVLVDKLTRPAQGRLYYIRYALKQGWTIARIFELSGIDPWFLENIQTLVQFEDELYAAGPPARMLLRGTPVEESETTARLTELLQRAKSYGYSDVQLGHIWEVEPRAVRTFARRHGVQPLYRLVDTCAAEFAAKTPYYYSTFERPPLNLPAGEPRDELRLSERPKVVVLGGGPNRIGQGIEFDYCCVHAAMAARELGYETVMINSNPETVSTDYDTSDLLFFEPLTHEDVVNICERLMGIDGPDGAPAPPEDQLAAVLRDMIPALRRSNLLKGVVCQFGGQTPLNLAMGLKQAGIPIIGTSPESIKLAEDRGEFSQILDELGIQQPPSGTARSFEEAKVIADRIGYPVLVRPSFVLGGRAMEICNNVADLRHFMSRALAAEGDHPILIDRFLSDAVEVDVDAVCDGETVVVAGVLEHIEEAGIHSGDSAMTLPPYSLSAAIVQQICYATKRIARRIGVIGLMNAQYAIKEDDIYVLEVNPRASRTVPFVAKATGIPWAKIAAKVMLGKKLVDLGVSEAPPRRHIAVKASVFPFDKFPGVDIALGPEMRSTGEVMGVDERFSVAFAKAQMGASVKLPMAGRVFLSVVDKDKPFIPAVARDLARLGFELIATKGTARTLQGAGLKVETLEKIRDSVNNPLTLIEKKQIALIINTPERTGKQTDEGKIRAAATQHRVPIFTTITGARAAVAAIRALKRRTWDVYALQDLWS